MIAVVPLPSAAALPAGNAPAPGAAAPADPGRPAFSPAAAGAAVESALQIGELQAQAQGAQSAVNLRFKVGSDNLSVNVSLQAGEVHAQFNTDSGELRTALAHAWPAVAAEAGAPRFADPIFAAGTPGGGGAALDLGSGTRQGSREQAQADEDTGSPPGRADAGFGEGDPRPASASAAPTDRAGALRLQTFA